MRRTLAAATAASTFILPAACSLAFPTGALTRDLGDDAGEGGSPDGGGDGAAGGADGGDAGPFCSRATHAFCDSFDRTNDVGAGWTETDLSGGDAGITTARSVSPPGAFVVTHPRRAPGAQLSFAGLIKSVTLPSAKVHIELDVFVESPAFVGGDGNMGLFCVDTRRGGTFNQVCLAISQAFVTFSKSDKRGAWPFDRWAHVVVDLEHGAPAKMTVDGVEHSGNPDTRAGAGDDLRLTFGLLGINSPAPAFTATYDNVTIDFR